MASSIIGFSRAVISRFITAGIHVTANDSVLNIDRKGERKLNYCWKVSRLDAFDAFYCRRRHTMRGLVVVGRN